MRSDSQVIKDERDRYGIPAGMAALMQRKKGTGPRALLTEYQFECRFIDQGGVCAVCFDPLGPDAHVDHDHESGLVRGLLCRSCNLGLGNFKDDPVRLAAAADYLREPVG